MTGGIRQGSIMIIPDKSVIETHASLYVRVVLSEIGLTRGCYLYLECISRLKQWAVDVARHTLGCIH